MQTVKVNVSDLSGAALDWCVAKCEWVRRYKVSASTARGAVNKFSREVGSGWRNVMDCGDFRRYDSATGCTCYFIELFDEDKHGSLSFVEV